jgi:hypothetical protein
MNHITLNTSNESIAPVKYDDMLHIMHAQAIIYFLLYFSEASAQKIPVTA